MPRKSPFEIRWSEEARAILEAAIAQVCVTGAVPTALIERCGRIGDPDRSGPIRQSAKETTACTAG